MLIPLHLKDIYKITFSDGNLTLETKVDKEKLTVKANTLTFEEGRINITTSGLTPIITI